MLTDNLSKKQIEAVNAIDDDVEIIACAGAGKTGVVTRRIINILKCKQNIEPKNIVEDEPYISILSPIFICPPLSIGFKTIFPFSLSKLPVLSVLIYHWPILPLSASICPENSPLEAWIVPSHSTRNLLPI